MNLGKLKNLPLLKTTWAMSTKGTMADRYAVIQRKLKWKKYFSSRAESNYTE
jgi:hypothetical protein